MVLGYHLLNRYDDLSVRLQKLGVRPLNLSTRPDGTTYHIPVDRPLVDEELFAWANALLLQTGATHDQRSVCYFCGTERTGRLCDCFREVVIQDWYDLRDRKQILSLAPNTIVTTSQCEDCGIPVPITARVVQKFYAKNDRGTYYGRKHCHVHWLERKKAKDQRHRAARQRKTAQAAPAPTVSLDLSHITTAEVGEA